MTVKEALLGIITNCPQPVSDHVMHDHQGELNQLIDEGKVRYEWGAFILPGAVEKYVARLFVVAVQE